MKRNNLLKLCFSLSGLFFCFNALSDTQNTSTNFQTNAQLSSACTMTASSVTWGTLILPAVSQGATGNISLLCTKSTPYNISLAYGGIYGQGTTTTQLNAGNIYVKANDLNTAYSYTGTKVQNYYNLPNGLTPSNYMSILNSQYNTGYGSYSTISPTTGGNAVPGGICATNLCRVYANNSSITVINVTSGTIYDYGLMLNGSYDSLKYVINLPNDSNQVWNTGYGVYNGVGLGVSENIPVRAKLIPTIDYPTPGVYLDSVTAKLNF